MASGPGKGSLGAVGTRPPAGEAPSLANGILVGVVLPHLAGKRDSITRVRVRSATPTRSSRDDGSSVFRTSRTRQEAFSLTWGPVGVQRAVSQIASQWDITRGGGWVITTAAAA